MLRCDVVGRVLMKARLSGMPELRLGLADRLEDVTFHQCVNLVGWSHWRVRVGESEADADTGCCHLDAA